MDSPLRAPINRIITGIKITEILEYCIFRAANRPPDYFLKGFIAIVSVYVFANTR